jgi:enoyl-CoA hydratase/carnithine racemase
MTNELLTRVENRVGFITFNRPETHNGFVPAFLDRLIATVKGFDLDPSVRSMVITGEGANFSSGGDKGFLRKVQSMSPQEVRTMVYGSFLGAVRAIKLCAKPVVAAINGGAVGAGCAVALACDFRIVTPKSFLHENWTTIGTIPPLGGMFLLPRLIGLERAANMIMRAQRVYGEEALSIGLASKLVAPEQLLAEARAFAEDLAARSPNALALAKVGLRRGMEGSLEGEWEFNLLAQSTLTSGPDFALALDALEAKRMPTY